MGSAGGRAMSDARSRQLAVLVLGASQGADLVPTDLEIESRCVPEGTRESAADLARADVLIVDLNGASETGGEGVGEIRRVFDPQLPVLIIAVSRDPAHASAALAAGATDFALLPRDRHWLAETILRERDRRLRPSPGSACDEPAGGTDLLVVEIPAAGLSFEAYERLVVENALARAGWNRSRAARELGISRPRLLRKIERHLLEAPPRTPREPPSE